MLMRRVLTLGGLFVLSVGISGACSSKKTDSDQQGGGGSGPIFTDGDGPDFGGADAGGGDEDPFGNGCVGQTAGTEAVPAVLQLVVDTSGSMDDPAPGTRDTKWEVTRDALLDAVEQMPGNTSVGVVFYPDVDTNGGTCFDEDADIAIAPLERAGSAQRSRIRTAFQGQSPDGGTPTHDAYLYAYGELADANVIGGRFAVLITDGNPTFSLGCEGTGLVTDPVDPTPLVGEATRAKDRGVKTFVIGSPGSEGARASLSRMAEAGGTAKANCSHNGPNYCHFDMTESRDFASDLEQALGTIAGLTLSCTYDIPEPPSGQILDPNRVNVLFTPAGGTREVISKDASGRCTEGWQYSDDGEQVVLCGSTCDRVQASQGTLSLQFGCETTVR
jgi:hypothetical protein